ncbi:MAG: phage tail protein [Saprospiraceae bacterium]
MARFGLITEGITDQIVIEYILAGFYNSADIQVDALQPLRDETDENLAQNSGNWHKVFEYCQAKEFEEALEENGNEYFLIIQIDTDIFDGESVGDKYQVQIRNEQNQYLSTEVIIKNTVDKFIELIGKQIYTKYQNQIIFAISVQSIECWLLPIYYTNKKKSEEANCLNKLNQELRKQEKFTISKKNPTYYREIAKKYRKAKTLKIGYSNQVSFEVFINDLIQRNIVIEQEDDW